MFLAHISCLVTVFFPLTFETVFHMVDISDFNEIQLIFFFFMSGTFASVSKVIT